VGAALTAALALAAVPGLAGSHEPSSIRPVDAAAFRQVNLATTTDRSAKTMALLDAAPMSAGRLDSAAQFSDARVASARLSNRAGVLVPQTRASSVSKYVAPIRLAPSSRAGTVLSGTASYYSNGTTAMRLPRGTVVQICGAAACIQRVITDYGPAAWTGRIVDLYAPDFVTVCGCGLGAGLTHVTITIY
jgi:hypothetical protein